MKKMFILVGVIIFLAIAAVGYRAYQQAKYNKQQLSFATAVATPIQGADSLAEGSVTLPPCISDGSCKSLDVAPRIELSDDIKNSMYIVDAQSVFDKGWHRFYSIEQPILGVRFLSVAQSLITRENYNKLFSDSVIDDKTFVQNFSVHCSDNKDSLPTINDRYCFYNDKPEDSYLFDYKGKRLISDAEFTKNLIYQALPDIGDTNSLETIKKMKESYPSTSSAFLNGFIPIDSPLEKIDVVYSGVISGNKLVPKDKIEEISYFKDNSQTTIKIK